MPGRLIWAQPSCGLHRSYGRLHATAAAAEAPFSQHVNGLSQIASNYEAVLLDQFGVLHDGKQTYSPATVAAVQRLAAAGLKVFIVSNSSIRVLAQKRVVREVEAPGRECACPHILTATHPGGQPAGTGIAT